MFLFGCSILCLLIFIWFNHKIFLLLWILCLRSLSLLLLVFINLFELTIFNFFINNNLFITIWIFTIFILVFLIIFIFNFIWYLFFNFFSLTLFGGWCCWLILFLRFLNFILYLFQINRLLRSLLYCGSSICCLRIYLLFSLYRFSFNLFFFNFLFLRNNNINLFFLLSF